MSDTPTNSPAAPVPAPKPAAPTPAATATAAPTAATPTPAAVPAAPPKPAEPVKFTAKPMKIGVVPFLNAQPLVWEMKNHHQIFQVPPSEMGALLKEGRLDVALAPIVAYFLNPELKIIPVAAIGSKGPVKSVRLLSHRALQDVETLYTDSKSQTSALLAQVILKKWFGGKTLKVKSVDIDTFRPNTTKPWEATLQIGDAALISPPTGMLVTDLGEEWFRYTQKPFVYATWMARSVPIAREIEMDLLACKNEGLKHFDEIVKGYKGIWVFEQPKLKEYLEKNIHYAYGPEEVKGQLEFQKLLKEQGLIL
jgi:chorismate dehydratase